MASKAQDHQEISSSDPAEDQARDIFGALDYVTKQFDVFENYKVDQYLAAYGLCVNPEYRGRGIATEMLKARVPILAAFGLEVTSTAFTGIGSQIAAQRADYKEDYVISFDDIAKTFSRFDFSRSVTKFYKTMSMTVR